jgi:hypothetical protein
LVTVALAGIDAAADEDWVALALAVPDWVPVALLVLPVWPASWVLLVLALAPTSGVAVLAVEPVVAMPLPGLVVGVTRSSHPLPVAELLLLPLVVAVLLVLSFSSLVLQAVNDAASRMANKVVVRALFMIAPYG